MQIDAMPSALSGGVRLLAVLGGRVMPRRRFKRRVKKKAGRARKQGSAYEELVAYVSRAFDPGSKVEWGQWVEGPDGVRDMDVVIEGEVQGQPKNTLIECKDFNPNTTGPVGIAFIDALDSKRQDLAVDSTLLCSNSGFTDGAIRKAKRKGIGLISVLKAEDERVKLKLREEIYFRHIDIGNTVNITFHFKEGAEHPPQVELEGATYRGKSVAGWVRQRAGIIAAANRRYSGGTVIASHRFIEPLEVVIGGESYDMTGIDLAFEGSVQWRAQTITIDASLGLYDYLRGRIRLAPGKQQYLMRDVNIHEGEPIDFEPPVNPLAASLLPGEMAMDLCLVKGAGAKDCAELDERIVPEDRSWTIDGLDPIVKKET